MLTKREQDKYSSLRKEYTAQTAFRFIKADRSNRAFYARMHDDNNDVAQFHHSDLLNTYVIDDKPKRDLQVYIAEYNDNDADFSDDYKETESSLYKYYRETAKLGKVQAREATKRALEKQAEYDNRTDRLYAYGCIVKVFWRGEEINEDSCWGYITSESDFEVFASEVYGNAVYGIRDKIRAAIKAERKQLMKEAFQAEFAI